MATKRDQKTRIIFRHSNTGRIVRTRAETLPTLGDDVVMFRLGKARNLRVIRKNADSARFVVPKVARALERPGLVKSAVFRREKSTGIFAYSTYSKDPTKVVRETSDGKRLIGRVARSGRFKAA